MIRAPTILGVDCVILPPLQTALEAFRGQIPHCLLGRFEDRLLSLLKIEGMNLPTKGARVVLGITINECDLEALRARFVPKSINSGFDGEVPLHGAQTTR